MTDYSEYTSEEMVEILTTSERLRILPPQVIEILEYKKTHEEMLPQYEDAKRYTAPPDPFSKEEYQGFAIQAAYEKGCNAPPANFRRDRNPYCEETEEDFFNVWDKGWLENAYLESEEDFKKSLIDAYDWGKHCANQPRWEKDYNPHLPSIHEQEDQLAAEWQRGFQDESANLTNSKKTETNAI